MAKKSKRPTLGAEHLGLNVIVTEQSGHKWIGQLVHVNAEGSAYVKPADDHRAARLVTLDMLSLPPNDLLRSIRHVLVELLALSRDSTQYMADRKAEEKAAAKRVKPPRRLTKAKLGRWKR